MTAVRSSDLVLGAVAAVAGATGAALQSVDAIAVAGAAATGAALAPARLHPRVAWVAAAGVIAGITAAGAAPFAVAVLASAHAFAAARGERLAPAVVALAVLTAALEAGVAVAAESFVPALVLPTAGWACGRALRAREKVAAQLVERVQELEQEREAHAALSVRYERARIASELHDIVAHAISIMVVQASAGQRLAPHDPDLTAETFRTIAGAARQAEQDMSRLVALLADDEPGGADPDLALLEELVARAAGSGLDVTLRFEGEREGLPPPAVECAYRVVQEGLTNALRYAAGAAVHVVVRGGTEELSVEVANGSAAGETRLAGSGTGTGLVGLRQRVAALGGTLIAGPTAGDGWRLSARVPRRAPARADLTLRGDGTRGIHPRE